MAERCLTLWFPELARAEDEVAALRDFARILDLVAQRCPFVEPLRLGLMTLPARAVTRFFGGEAAFATRIREDLAQEGLDLRIGAAEGLFAAVLAARDDVLIPLGATSAYLSRQSLSVLHRPEVAELCERLGVRTLGAFARLEADRVLERFGVDALHCHGVARGQVSELDGLRDPSIRRRLGLLDAPETPTVQVGFFGGATLRDERAQRIAIRLQQHFGVASVLAATEQAGRDPAERVQLNAFAIEGNTGRHDGAPWPARLPTPSPMTIFTNAATVTLADASGTGVGIDGAGLLSGVPTTLVESRARHELVAWAGPWPLSGPWWRRSLRHSRLQVLTDANCALLLDYQDRNWRLVGRYD